MSAPSTDKSRLVPRRARFLVLLTGLALLVALAGLALTQFGRGRPADTTPFQESFDAPGEWQVGEDANAAAQVTAGRYEVLVKAPGSIYIGGNDLRFADGVVEVTATQVAGPVDNGYGLVLRHDPATNSFYMFEVSGDGFFWAGFCRQSCGNQGWEASPAVRPGLGAPNRLRVEASGANLTFIVNDVVVARVDDPGRSDGLVGLLVETFGLGGVQVAFDDLRVSPP